MARKKKVPLQDGSTIDATIRGFQSGGEHWNEYLVDDGSLIRVKLVATEILRLDGQFDADGNPLYLLNSTNVMTVEAPEDLKHKEEES